MHVGDLNDYLSDRGGEVIGAAARLPLQAATSSNLFLSLIQSSKFLGRPLSQHTLPRPSV